jgi:hypothetical protein
MNQLQQQGQQLNRLTAQINLSGLLQQGEDYGTCNDRLG